MNVSNKNTIEDSQYPDGQGRWYELLSPRQVLTEQGQQQDMKIQRNRKLQRYRRKLRKRGLTDETISMCMNLNHSSQEEQSNGNEEISDEEEQEVIALNDTMEITDVLRIDQVYNIH